MIALVILVAILLGLGLWFLLAGIAGGLGMKWHWWYQSSLETGGWFLIVISAPILLPFMLACRLARNVSRSIAEPRERRRQARHEK